MMVISSQSHTQHVHKSMDILGEDKVNVKFLSSWKMVYHVSLCFLFNLLVYVLAVCLFCLCLFCLMSYVSVRTAANLFPNAHVSPF